jgi:hypothetical protein
VPIEKVLCLAMVGYCVRVVTRPLGLRCTQKKRNLFDGSTECMPLSVSAIVVVVGTKVSEVFECNRGNRRSGGC